MAKSKTKMIEEIKKCAVVCASCHRKLHAGRDLKTPLKFAVIEIDETDDSDLLVALCNENRRRDWRTNQSYFQEVPMTEHDRVRKDRALDCDTDDLESLQDAIRGLQSTDDPSLVPLHDELMERYLELKKKKETT